MQIKPTSLTLNQLFGSSNEQYVIPSYQRRYSWGERQIYELLEDIELLEGADTHLLGNIVCLTRAHQAGVNPLELVDGQQRLTTIAILLHCILERLKRDERADLAAEANRLTNARAPNGGAHPKILLDSIDRKDFERLQSGVEASGNPALSGAFGILRKWVDDYSPDEFSAFFYKLQNQALIIRLDVSEAKDAFKLFETINNRGLRLSATDIIKNFLLGNAARFGADSLEVARDCWTRLLRCLDGVSTELFFRNYLTARLTRRVTRAYVVPEFKSLFMSEVLEAGKLPDRKFYVDEPSDIDDTDGEETDPAIDATTHTSTKETQVSFNTFLARLLEFAKTFSDLVQARTGDPRIDRHLRGLRMIKATQTFGFLMHLRVGGCDDKSFISILKITEAFVLRRHVCRKPANETEHLFARLCGTGPSNPVHVTRSEYRQLCPSDAEFQEDFAAVNFTSNIQDRARYCLEVIELSSHGEHAELSILGPHEVHIEHIIPQKIKTKKAKQDDGDWVEYLGPDAVHRHPRMVSRIGNLTLFSGLLNCSASNNPFLRKRAAYNESSIKMTRELANYSVFKFKQVEERSRELAERTVALWPIP